MSFHAVKTIFFLVKDYMVLFQTPRFYTTSLDQKSPIFNLLVVCPKSLVLVLFRVPQELFALVARETELARVFDLHLLPEQDQLGVAPVCVIVLDLANVFVMINPPAW